MYDTLQTIHVLAAVVWVGGGVFHVFASAQLDGASPEVMERWAAVGQRAGQVYYGPAAILTLLAGIGMVLVGDISWGEPFISIGLGGVAASIVLGAVLVERASKELTAEIEGGGGDPERVAELTLRIRMLSVADVAILTVVIWAMVVQPG